MFVNCFTVTVPAGFDQKELSNSFGKNIPKPLQFEGGDWGFITFLFCVDEKVDISLCKKYGFKTSEPIKIEIDDFMYNNNYIIQNNYITGQFFLKSYLKK
jgi:hypothetical protein